MIQGVRTIMKEESSPYFCQIQCQLAVTKRKWCDLVIYTHSGMFTQRVNFDAVFFFEENYLNLTALGKKSHFRTFIQRNMNDFI